MWWRVFCLANEVVSAAALQEQVRHTAPRLRCRFQGDEEGWYHVALTDAADVTVAEIHHYRATEAGIRPQLNTWAAWLEVHEHNQHSGPLMQHVIQTTQLFCLNALAPSAPDANWERLCRWLACRTDGVFQADGRGFHAADGTPLVAEEP